MKDIATHVTMSQKVLTIHGATQIAFGLHLQAKQKEVGLRTGIAYKVENHHVTQRTLVTGNGEGITAALNPGIPVKKEKERVEKNVRMKKAKRARKGYTKRRESPKSHHINLLSYNQIVILQKKLE